MLWHPMYGSMSFSLFCRGCGSTAIGRSVWRLATNTWRRVTTSLPRYGRLQPNGEISFQVDDDGDDDDDDDDDDARRFQYHHRFILPVFPGCERCLANGVTAQRECGRHEITGEGMFVGHFG